MKRIAAILASALVLVVIVQVMRPQVEPLPPAETLRDAMQHRMQDVLRIRAELDAGKVPSAAPFHAFAGLPNSEFVEDVSEYQAYFALFDDMYADIFTSENPRLQFNMVMNSCIACHQNVCPGPLRGMNRLVIAELDL
jgi:hypothetical protein